MRLFDWAATRRLSAVDIDPTRSNQHEIGGIKPFVDHLSLRFRRALGPREDLEVRVLILHDDHEPEELVEQVTLYDTRHTDPNRSAEWRLYYPHGGALEQALAEFQPGDLLLISVGVDSTNYLIMAPRHSQWERSLLDTFPTSNEQAPGRLGVVDPDALRRSQDRPVASLLADALGALHPTTDDESWLVERLGPLQDIDVPSPTTMAELAWARVQAEGMGADEQVLLWLEAETRLFYVIEGHEASRRFADCDSMEDHLEQAKSILNRRRVRRGLSLEKHLAEAFRRAGLIFEEQVTTEAGSVADFILPGGGAYADPSFPVPRLTHLAAKSTARERWKQVLSEARRMDERHLATVDQQLSSATRDDMSDRGVVLVMTAEHARIYDDPRILTVGDFIRRARARGEG